MVGQPSPAASARLTGGGKAYALDDLHVRWGESELDGGMRADFAAAKPRLDGRLQAQRLDLATMLPLLASSDQGPASPDVPAIRCGRLPATRPLGAGGSRVDLPSNLVLRHRGDPGVGQRETAVGANAGRPARGAIEGELAAAPWRPTTSPSTRLTANGVGVAGLAGPGYDGKVDGRSRAPLQRDRPR